MSAAGTDGVGRPRVPVLGRERHWPCPEDWAYAGERELWSGGEVVGLNFDHPVDPGMWVAVAGVRPRGVLFPDRGTDRWEWVEYDAAAYADGSGGRRLSARELLAVSGVVEKYRLAYGGDLQGLCLVVADEVRKVVGGQVVAGYLCWYGGSCRRSHWWVEAHGAVVDPIGDEFLEAEVATWREEVHRDAGVFASVLPRYEKYRL